MKQAKISIITVCRNVADELRTTALSVINLNYSCKEYIIIDGASTDNTLQVIDEIKHLCEEKQIPFRFVSEKDKGIYDAMNKGVCLSSGEWINFMNAGDIFVSKNCLQDVEGALNNNENDVVYCSVGKVMSFGTVEIKPRELSLLKRKMPFCHQSTFCRKTHLVAYPFSLSYPIAADYDLFHHIYVNGGTFEQVNVIISLFDATKGASSQNRLQTTRECGRISGRLNTFVGKLEYLGQVIEVGFNKITRAILPNKTIKTLRSKNYNRKNKA